jgi:hypothetical protein
MKHLGKVRTKSIQEVVPEWNDIQKKIPRRICLHRNLLGILIFVLS